MLYTVLGEDEVKEVTALVHSLDPEAFINIIKSELMAVSGGMSIATGVCGILQKDSGILMLLIMAVCVPAGVLFQFMTTHK